MDNHNGHNPVYMEGTRAWVCSCGALLSKKQAEKILQKKGK